MIFTLADLRLRWSLKGDKLQHRIHYHLGTGEISQIHKRLYVTGSIENLSYFDYCGLANKVVTPSYVSFESALIYHGVVFPFNDRISVAYLFSKRTKLNIPGKSILIIRAEELPPTVLDNPHGITEIDGIRMASRERAVADILHRSPEYWFDHPELIDLELLESMIEIYIPISETTPRVIRDFIAKMRALRATPSTEK